MSSYKARKALLRKIQTKRKSKVLLYVTGDRRGLETQISREVIDLFVDHLDAIGPVKKISLILHTNGGDMGSAWSIINLIRTFCDELEVIVPLKALSAGTIISLGANSIVMTKQAMLGPIDPSSNHPLNPARPGANPGNTVPVSVEAVRGYLDAAQKELKITDSRQLADMMMHLADKVHPLVLGQIFRTRDQIRDLAGRLLEHQVQNQAKKEKIINFLCSDSGSHDYTINRREAKKLGLNIEKPSDDFYSIINELNVSYREELELLKPFNLHSYIGKEDEAEYKLPRCLVESVAGGSHQFISQGKITKIAMPGPNGVGQVEAAQDSRLFEGWRKEA